MNPFSKNPLLKNGIESLTEHKTFSNGLGSHQRADLHPGGPHLGLKWAIQLIQDYLTRKRNRRAQQKQATSGDLVFFEICLPPDKMTVYCHSFRRQTSIRKAQLCPLAPLLEQISVLQIGLTGRYREKIWAMAASRLSWKSCCHGVSLSEGS